MSQLIWDKIDQSELYKIITQNFSGIITVTNRDGIVVYAQNLPPDTRHPLSEWVGHPMEKWLQNQFLTGSPSLRAIKSQKCEMEFLGADGKHPIMTMAQPVLDENEELEYVVAYSLPEKLVHAFSQAICAERNRATQLVNYLSTYQDKKMFLLTEDKQIKNILAILDRVAGTDSTIMLTGETGVGKEVFSRYIHSKSDRVKEVFIPVNCSAIPSELMESEFFGYDRGAFTGANKEGKLGLFELASNGILFLDEIGELPLAMQPKLLRVLESGEYRKVGGNKTCKTNVRIIGATNRDLYQMVKEHTFREDLYYRLNVIPIRIPPLRERRGDIIPMAKFFLSELNQKYSGSKIFLHETLESFLAYQWPGNIRELSNVVEKLYITSTSDVLSLDGYLNILSVEVSSSQNIAGDSLGDQGETQPLKDIMRSLEERYIQRVLKSCNGKVALAADKLQITKAGLYKKLDSYKRKEENS